MSNAISKWKRSMFVLIVHWFYVDQEEALQAFIQPETLDGPNQYFCERCKKKCDARKVSQIRDDDCLVVCHISSPLQFLCSVFFFLSRAWDSSISHTCWLCSWNALTLITPLCTALNSMTAWPSPRSWTWALSSTSRMRWDAVFVLSFLWLRRTELISPALLTSHITTYSYILWKYVVLNII